MQVELSSQELNFLVGLIEKSDPTGMYRGPVVHDLVKKFQAALMPPAVQEAERIIEGGEQS